MMSAGRNVAVVLATDAGGSLLTNNEVKSLFNVELKMENFSSNCSSDVYSSRVLQY